MLVYQTSHRERGLLACQCGHHHHDLLTCHCCHRHHGVPGIVVTIGTTRRRVVVVTITRVNQRVVVTIRIVRVSLSQPPPSPSPEAPEAANETTRSRSKHEKRIEEISLAICTQIFTFVAQSILFINTVFNVDRNDSKNVPTFQYHQI